MTFGPVRSRWDNGTIVLASEMDQLDANTASALLADFGGTWNPSTPIILQAAAGYTGPVFVALGTILVGNGLVVTPSGSGARITFGDDDYYTLPVGHPGHGFARQTSFNDCASSSLPGTAAFGGDVQSLYPGQLLALQLRVHDGATISSVAVTFAVPTVHASVPANLPKFRVVVVDATGTKTPLTSTASGADSNGWVPFPRPASGTAWHAAGAVQTMTITCDGVPLAAGGTSNYVQTARNVYQLEIVDENGANAFAPPSPTFSGTIWCEASVTFTNIYSMRPQ